MVDARGAERDTETIRIVHEHRSSIIPRVLSSDPATGRRRSHASRDAILAATHALLEEVGFAKLSIEAVAARAGVGKATIYRWWSSKGTLAMEAFLGAVAPTIGFPATASARSDIMVQIHKVAKAYRGRAGRIVREMIGLGQFDPETMRTFVEGYLQPRRSAAKTVIQRGIDQGEFRRDIDLEVVVDSLYGPIFHRLLTSHGAIDDKFITAHVALILDSISA
jgi:AcrR family transcriptional regulator